jgi:hypothetical protein
MPQFQIEKTEQDDLMALLWWEKPESRGRPNFGSNSAIC